MNEVNDLSMYGVNNLSMCEVIFALKKSEILAMDTVQLKSPSHSKHMHRLFTSLALPRYIAFGTKRAPVSRILIPT